MEKILIRPMPKKRISSSLGLWTVVFVCVFLLFLAFPQKVKEGVSKGLSLCVDGIIPSLFPFAVLSSFFAKTGFTKWVSRPFSAVSRCIFRGRGEFFALWLTGLVAGFPIGARSAGEMYRCGALSKKESEVCAAFSNSPSPAFVIAFCGGLFDSSRVGLLLFLTLTLSSIICGAILCRIFKITALPTCGVGNTMGTSSVLSSFTGACVSGWESINTVCSFVIFFSAVLSLGEWLMRGILCDPLGIAVFRGLFELTAGISSLGDVGLSLYCKFVFAALILSFSGLCANMQVICFLKDAELDAFPYIVGRSLTVVVCTALSCVIGLLL